MNPSYNRLKSKRIKTPPEGFKKDSLNKFNYYRYITHGKYITRGRNKQR